MKIDSMSTTADIAFPPSPAEEFKPYRAISRSAVLSLVLALGALPISILTVVAAKYSYGDAVSLGFWTAVIAIFSAALGWIGLRGIRRFPNEYTGKILAQIGLVLGLVQFAAGVALSAYTYATEVPEGYTRVGFWELRPDQDERLIMPISPKAIEIAGKPIFIKGYMHPGVSSGGKVTHFILVPDMGTCCFGGQPKPYDMIEVRIPDQKSGVAYSTRRMKLAGTFDVSRVPGQSLGLQDVWYHLEVDQVR
jgi:hypothetical protein